MLNTALCEQEYGPEHVGIFICINTSKKAWQIYLLWEDTSVIRHHMESGQKLWWNINSEQ